MAKWKNISVGFNIAEETLNFGTRAAAIADGVIYECTTVATIQTEEEEEVGIYPSCSSVFSKKAGLAIACDKSVILFDTGFTTTLLSAHFDSIVDYIEISSDGQFIFCGLRDHKLVCLFVPNGGQILFSKSLVESEISYDDNIAFSRIISKCTDKYFEVYAFLSNGRIFKISYDNLQHILDAAKLAQDNELENNITFSQIPSTVENGQNVFVSQFISYEEREVLFQIHTNFNLFSCENGIIDTIMIGNPYKIKQVEHSPSSHILLCLCDDGSMLSICAHTFQVLKTWNNEKVKSFSLLENSDEYNAVFSIVIITDSDKPEICLVELPAFEVKLRLKVGSPSYLVEKQSSTEDIVYIEGYGENSKVDTIRIKAVDEISPEFRLDRLLQRCKFEEAEQFAQSLSLSLEIVFKAKVKWLMGKLVLINKTPDYLSTIFDELSQLLDKIQDVEFVAECSLKVIAPDVKMIQRLFDYATKRLRQCSNKTPAVLNLMEEVNKSNVTLGTYVQIHEDTSSPENWLIFLNANPIMICRNHLVHGEIQKAVIVCRRHKEKIRNELPTGVATELLQKIPPSTPIDEVLKWLRVYSPVLLAAHPDLLQTLVLWVINRTKALELEKKNVWPEHGLSFVMEVMEILKSLPVKDPYFEIPVSVQANSDSVLSPLATMQNFARHLHQLSLLKKEYSILLVFDEYSNTVEKQDGHQEIINLILDNVSDGKVASLISGFLKDFCAENFLERDLILSNYVIKMVTTSSSWWDMESAWEFRAISLISYIQSTNHKMKAIETTVLKASVPWSPDMASLAKEAMKIDHPLAESIYHHMKHIPIKVIMRKYGLHKNEFVDINGFIRFIYKQNQDSMIEDTKELVKSGDSNEKLLPYIVYLLHTIELGEIEKGLQLMKAELEEEDVVKVTQQVISNLMIFLQNRTVTADDKAFDAIPTLYSTLMALNSVRASELEQDINCLRSYRSLRIKHKMFMPLSTLHGPRKEREKILSKHLAEFFIADESSISRNIENAGEIAHLLNLPRELGILELSYLFASKENIQLSTLTSRLLLDSEDSFFKCYSKRILELLTIQLDVATKSEKVDEDCWETIQNALRKVSLLGKINDAVRVADLISLAKLFSTPKQSSNNAIRHFHAEKIEAPVHPPPASYCSKLINGPSQPQSKDPSLFQKEIERTLQAMPHSITSIHHLQTIVWTLLPREELTDLKQILEISKERVFNILPRIIFSRHLDLELALGLLNIVPIECGMAWLQNCISTRRENWGNLKNASAVALIGKHFVTLTTHWNHWNLQKSFTEQYLKFECFIRLKQFGIAPKVADTFCESHDGKRTLLLKLMGFGVDLNFLFDFCRDLNFSFQECLQLYLEHSLLTWKPITEEPINPKTGKSDLVLLSKKEDLALKCSQIEALIESKDTLVDYLKKIILPRVNFYYYEVFMVIIDTIVKLSPTHQEAFSQHQFLLSFLISYRRISPVSSEETDNWFHFFPHLSSLPHISKYRLPFAPLPSDPWKIIKPELTLKTYKMWLIAPTWLNVTLEKDIICSFTIMNLKGEVTTNSEWNLHFQYKSLLTEISECIARIQNIETAVAAAYCVVNYIMPPGADRVDAAQRCFLKAQEWVALEHSESARIGLMKAEKKYLTVSTYHFLYKYQLAKPEYLGLAHQPNNLISALYEDSSIISRSNDLTSPHPDINKAVCRIAALHDINLTGILKELLTEWLQQNDSLNSSVEEVDFFLSSSTHSDNIIRACYVLTGFKKIEELENFMLSIAFGQETHSKSAGIRLRALQCLCAAKDTRDLECLTARNMSSIKELMLTLEFISDLEKFALDYTEIEFDSCYKEEIVKTLLLRSCPEAIVLSAKICITFQIWSPSIWNSLLSNMISLKMIKVLEYCLPELGRIATQIDEAVFKEAWESLLFTLLSKGRSGDKADLEIQKSFALIESCPIMTSLDLYKIIQLYEKLNHPEMADALAKFT